MNHTNVAGKPPYILKPDDEVATTLSRAGFALIEGNERMLTGKDDDAIDAMRQLYASYGIAIETFHLQDNDGARDLHLPPGRGLVEWGPIFRRMAEMKFAHAACIEAPPFAYGPGYSHPQEAWDNMVRETDELVSAALA